MTENEIIIANLKAQVIAWDVERRILRQWTFNQDFSLRANVLEKCISLTDSEIKKLSKK